MIAAMLGVIVGFILGTAGLFLYMLWVFSRD